MKKIAFSTVLILLFGIFAMVFSGCDNSSSDGDDNEAVCKAFYDAAESESVAIDPSINRVTINNVLGKTIYMVRMNPKETVLEEKKQRTAVVKSGILNNGSNNASNPVQSSVMKEFPAENHAVPAFDLQALEKQLEKDPRYILEEKLNELMKKSAAQSSGQVSRNATDGQTEEQTVTPQVFHVGDKTSFYTLDPNTLETFEKKEYELLASGDEYYVWVKEDDPYYIKDKDAFKLKAEKLGTEFINGYGLVRYIYGETYDKLYNEDGKTPYGNMAECSRTGTKINILLYSMVDEGKVYGFVYHGDVFKGLDGSNEGRFLYMDSQTLLDKPLEAYLTAMHEFSHTISMNQKRMMNGKDWTYWYGELLAMMCEDLMQSYLGITDSFEDEGLLMTPKVRLMQANSGVFWSTGLTGQANDTYAAVFMMGAWLSRNFGGVKFIKELARNGEVDMTSILMAVNACSDTSYDAGKLLKEYAESLMFQKNDFGLNHDSPLYPENSEFFCDYSDGIETHTYYYPLTAVNLWDPFYGWYNLSEKVDCIANESIPFEKLPAVKKRRWEDNVPTSAYLGPIMFNDGTMTGDEGPYGVMLYKLGTAGSDSVTFNLKTKEEGETPQDELIFWFE